MYSSVLTKAAPLLCLVVATISVGFSSVSAAAASVNRCEMVFFSDLQRLPKPSEIAVARAGEVHSMAGQAAIMLKITQVIPPGRYEVIVRDQNGQERADILTIATTVGKRDAYASHGLEFRIGSTTILRTEPAQLRFSSAPGREGDVQGTTTRMRLESGNESNQVILVNSQFSGNLTSPQGSLRQDTSVELTLTRRRSIVIVVNQNVRSSVANNGVDTGIQTQFSVDVKGPVKAPQLELVN